MNRLQYLEKKRDQLVKLLNGLEVEDRDMIRLNVTLISDYKDTDDIEEEFMSAHWIFVHFIKTEIMNVEKKILNTNRK